jgi:NAD(P)-dependent dehydrogenase (short-subunit alcohol dehydrogenase family)
MSKLKDKIAVITGGSSGIGLAIAKLFTENGAKVVIFGRNKKRLNEALGQFPNNVLAIQGDIGNLKDLDNLYNKVQLNLGNIDIIVANAGDFIANKIEDVTETEFDYLINTNIKGTYFTVQRALKYLNLNSSIILISSLDAHRAKRNSSVYAATKAAISQFSKSLSADLHDRSIRINCISPGYVLTPKFDDVDESLINDWKSQIPLGDFGDAYTDIAPLAIYLASDDSKYMTGEDIIIDGGMTRYFK